MGMEKPSALKFAIFSQVFLAFAACGDDAADADIHTPDALPASVSARFEQLEGPLGCAPTTSFTPDPPDGCAGAQAFVAAAKREYLAVASDHTDLPARLAAYQKQFAAAHPFVSHSISRDGFIIAAREFGAEHANDGPSIVLMHGFPDNQHLYDYVAPALGAAHRTITFDFVGWGDSSQPPPDYAYTIDSLRADLDAVVGYFGSSAIVPVVHDASGWPGIDWALDNESKVRALVLLNTTYQLIAGIAPPYVIRALSASDLRQQFIDALGDDPNFNRALFRAQVGMFFDDDAARADMLPVLEAQLPGAALVGLTSEVRDGSIARLENVPRMATFAKPVAIAFGADDRMLNRDVANGLAMSFPHASLEMVDGAAHYVQLDQPERVVAVVNAAASGE